MSFSASQARVFVGREREIARLRHAYDLVSEKSGAIALIAGEAGIGKTSLARFFADSCEQTGAQLCVVRGYEGGWAPPYAPWLEGLRGLSDDLPEFDLDLEHQADPEAARFLYHAELHRVLTLQATEQPVVIVLDDLQWFDAGSREFLRYLAHFALDMRLFVIGTYRDQALGDDADLARLVLSLQRTRGAISMQLAGLQTGEVAALLERADRHLSPRELDDLHRATAGHPLFLTELLAGWRETPELRAIPAGIQQMVRDRLSRLHADAQQVMQQAAMFTAGFEFSVLAPLTGLPEASLLDAVDELLAANLLEARAERGPERYDFVHALVREAIVQPLNPSRRVRLERRAAEAMERAYGELAELHAAELAIQFSRSASLPGAEQGLRYALLAAQQARRGFDREQVARFLGIAQHLASRADVRVQAAVLCELAVALADCIRIEEAVAVAKQALEMLERSGAKRELVLQFYGDLVTSLKQHASAEGSIWRPLLEHGLSVAKREHDLHWARLQLLHDPVRAVATSPFRIGRWIGFDAEAVAIARFSDDEATAARAVESFEYRNRAETDAYLLQVQAWSDPGAVMYGLTVTANDYQYRHGAFREAGDIWRQLGAFADRHGAINWQAQSANQLTFIAIALGDFAEARRLEALANSLIDRLGAGRRPEVLAREMATTFAFELGGDWPTLAREWRAVVEDPALTPHDPATLSNSLNAAFVAYAYAESGEMAAARAVIARLTPILESLGAHEPNQNGAVAIAAGAVWRLQLVEFAPRYRELAHDLLANDLGDYPQSSLELTLARMAVLSDHHDDAAGWFAQARNRLDASGQRPQRAMVDFDEATAMLRAGDRANALLRLLAAIDAFESLGMTMWAERAHRLVTEASAPAIGKDGGGGLSEREIEVVQLVVRGYSDRQISDELFISPRTVNAHIRNMLNKTDTANRTELSVWAVARSLAGNEAKTT